MKQVTLTIITIFLFLSTSACTKLDQRATMANLKNVLKISAENDAYIEESETPSSLKMAAQVRNEEACDLAKEMAIHAGNEEVKVEAAMAALAPEEPDEEPTEEPVENEGE